MLVKEIKKLKSGKYKVKIDDKTITTYDDVILKNRLLYKKSIDSGTYDQLEIDSNYYDAYHKTVNYILRKLRSALEIETYLEEMGVPAADADKILQKLKEIGLVNDEVYVKSYISDSFYLSNDGPCKIQNYLLSQEIDEIIIEEEICKLDREEIKSKLQKLILKKVKNDKRHSAYQLKQKVIVDMVNLGYIKDMVLEVLEECNLTDNDKLQKEYEKLYQKYSRKLAGKDLYKKIKEKLYSKGFDINEIQSYINQKMNDE